MEVGKAKMKIAIGFCGGGVVVELIESNDQIESDVRGLQGYAEDLFHNSEAELPKKAGIYLFEGTAHCSTDEYGRPDDSWYVGAFTPLAQ